MKPRPLWPPATPATAAQPGDWNTAPWLNPFFGGVFIDTDAALSRFPSREPARVTRTRAPSHGGGRPYFLSAAVTATPGEWRRP